MDYPGRTGGPHAVAAPSDFLQQAQSLRIAEAEPVDLGGEIEDDRHAVRRKCAPLLR